ncbi:MAG: dialkylresorcinol condensing enzyme [Desulfobulbaceae bacterium]|jgi:hypothetical protein|nr:dialkylresorcinol condensing enzyme [Desulfobulbaceae bacterium]
MKKIQALYYSQSGQLRAVLESLCRPLEESGRVKLMYTEIKPRPAFPYPWRFYDFFDTMAESVLDRACPIEPVPVAEDADLILLGATVWFLSPSLPLAAFLNSEAANMLRGKPVVTVIACRDMWLMAYERLKEKLLAVGARHLDNVVFVDQGKSLFSFVTTPRWLLTGKKNAFLFFPAAGVAPAEIQAAQRFGERILQALQEDAERHDAPLLRGLGAVRVVDTLIASEKIAIKSFRLWSRFMEKAGAPGSGGRRLVITIYIIFLLVMICTLVPINLCKNAIMAKVRPDMVEAERRRSEAPSGR